MTMDIAMPVTGLKEALRTINSVNPKLRKAYGKQIRELGKVVVDAITPLIPDGAPSRGFEHQGRTGWTGNQSKKVVIKTNTRRARKRNIELGAKYETIGVITVGTKGAALAIADMAGKGGGGGRGGVRSRPNFAPMLNDKIGRGPSRFVWAGGLKAVPDFQKALAPVIREVIFEANKELMKVKF